MIDNVGGSTIGHELFVNWQVDVPDRPINAKYLLQVIFIDVLGQLFHNNLQKVSKLSSLAGWTKSSLPWSSSVPDYPCSDCAYSSAVDLSFEQRLDLHF
jgi:hypothetical protein